MQSRCLGYIFIRWTKINLKIAVIRRLEYGRSHPSSYSVHSEDIPEMSHLGQNAI